MDSDELERRFDAVDDRGSFFRFVEALVADREDEVEKEKQRPSSLCGPGANGWENGTIETYLDAALRCAEDSRSFPEEPSWKAFAQFLYSGKYYE